MNVSTVRTNGGIVPLHPYWQQISLQSVHEQLVKQFNLTGSVELIHAWSNLIYTNNSSVYKITPSSRSEEAVRSVQLSRYVQIGLKTPNAIADPCTMRTSEHVWTVTTWGRMQLRQLTEKERESLETWERLGQLVGKLHTLPPQPMRLPLFNPCKWSMERVSTLISAGHPLAHEIDKQHRELHERILATMQNHPTVLLHGDIHLDNLAVEETSQEIVLLDFESSCVGPAVGDLHPSAGWVKRSGHPTREQTAALIKGYLSTCPTNNIDMSTTQNLTNLLTEVRKLSTYTWELLNGTPTKSI